MKKIVLILPLLVLTACLSSKKGEETTTTSDNPSTATTSEAGKSAEFLHGKGAPSNSIGENYSHYYDEDSKYVWEKNNGQWINQYTIGSESLLDKESNRALDNNKKKILKNALATSFYSTNTTVDYIPRAESGWDLLTKINGRDIILDSNTPGAFSQPYYVRMSETGVPWLYKDGSYVEFPEQMFYCMIPHPTVEKVVYENYILFDDELGMQTSIIAGHLDDAIYNEETHFYDISNIQIHHSAIATHYLVTPTEDTMVFNFGFKLSSDESYVTNAYIEFVSSESFPVYNGFGLDYVFSDMHSTTVDMPN